MARAYMIAQMAGGAPNFTDGAGVTLLCRGYSLAWNLNSSWGGYIVSGTAAELLAINALPQVYAICALGDLDNVISSARRTRLNTWLTERGWSNIPAGWTYRAIIEAIYRRANAAFQLAALDVVDA